MTGTAQSDTIHDVIITPLKQICDERGKVMHMLRADDTHFKKFGEIYFSCINPGAIKAWHLHEKMTLNYACVNGMIKLVLYDDRKDSVSNGVVQEVFIGESNYKLVTIPPNIWNGFKGISTGSSIVANCSSIAHDPYEIRRLDPIKNDIPYDWSIKHG